MDAVVIRPAAVADAPQIAFVHVRSWQAAYRGLLPQAYLDQLDPAERLVRWERALTQPPSGPATVLIAEERKRVLGFAALGASRDEDAVPGTAGEVGALYALPDAWGRGVGRGLMAEALAWFSAAGFAEATLWVLDTNARARRFYGAGGWSADGAVKTDERAGFPIAEVRYRRPVPPSAPGPSAVTRDARA